MLLSSLIVPHCDDAQLVQTQELGTGTGAGAEAGVGAGDGTAEDINNTELLLLLLLLLKMEDDMHRPCLEKKCCSRDTTC